MYERSLPRSGSSRATAKTAVHAQGRRALLLSSHKLVLSSLRLALPCCLVRQGLPSGAGQCKLVAWQAGQPAWLPGGPARPASHLVGLQLHIGPVQTCFGYCYACSHPL